MNIIEPSLYSCMFSYPSLIRKRTNSSYSVIGTRKIANIKKFLVIPEIIRFSINDNFLLLTKSFDIVVSFIFADQLMYTLIFF